MLKKLKRTFIVLVAIAICTVGYARWIEPSLLVVKSFVVETEKPIRNCKVVFFTDTHFGALYPESNAEKIVEKINGLHADIVIFGGDLFDHYARDKENMDLEYLQNTLGQIKAVVGKYAIWGNHDYGGGAVRIYEEFMSACGFEVLDDESRVLETYGIRLIGYDDYLMGWTDPSLYTIQSTLFNIIIAHEPIVSQLVKSKSDNFLFSGHTHGGQVNIPFVTDKFFPEGSGKFVKGYYAAEEIGTEASLRMYTSSGIGMTRVPFRLFNIPEIIAVQFSSKE